MKLKIDDLVFVRNRCYGIGKVKWVSGKYFKADFFLEDGGVEYLCWKISISDIERIITDKKEIKKFKKIYKI